MKQKLPQTDLASMKISDVQLSKFTMLFEAKTGIKLSESEALTKAETLLRTISILYRPISTADYCSTLAKKLSLKATKLNTITK